MKKIDLTKCLAAQDMTKIVMAKKGLSPEEAIKFSVNEEMHKQIVDMGYAELALDIWGHADPYRKWQKLKEPILEIDFDELSKNLIKDITKKEKVDYKTAVSYFLLFTMDSLGYHI